MTGGSSQFGIKGSRVVTPTGVSEAVVIIRDGVIADVVSSQGVLPDLEVVDAGDLVVMAGLVDSHVHVNEPGRTEWEGFETATRAAAAGGITTIVDMPLNCIPVTTSLSAFKHKLAEVSDKLWVDCGYFGGVVPGVEDELSPMAEEGVLGFKCFLVHSGIDDFPQVSREDLKKAMPILAGQNLPLLVHAELENSEGRRLHPDQTHDKYEDFLASRPRSWENEAIEMMIELSDQYKCPVHIVHLSSSDALPQISNARKSGLRFTVETCPHYLTLASEDIADGDTRFKCAPPIREKENQEKLWQGLKEGQIDFVVSDHSPCHPELKKLDEGCFGKAWGGISSLQFTLPVVWTEARKRDVSLETLSEWMCKRPAEFLGLAGKKGIIAKGADADLVVWDPDAQFEIEERGIHHRHKLTPHEGKKLAGVVRKTYLRGRVVYEDGNFPGGPFGKSILKARKEKSELCSKE